MKSTYLFNSGIRNCVYKFLCVKKQKRKTNMGTAPLLCSGGDSILMDARESLLDAVTDSALESAEHLWGCSMVLYFFGFLGSDIRFRHSGAITIDMI
ncbi:MAG: hypothetical protein KKD69_09405 [Euryarchaeota archaeon]|nr:hypothetical protein [Euryarchaeota archaeon]MBU4492663.1 hypothetical protein [Euryarchaeota archaeon]